jgi:hypothetical protein
MVPDISVAYQLTPEERSKFFGGCRCALAIVEVHVCRSGNDEEFLLLRYSFSIQLLVAPERPHLVSGYYQERLSKYAVLSAAWLKTSLLKLPMTWYSRWEDCKKPVW